MLAFRGLYPFERDCVKLGAWGVRKANTPSEDGIAGLRGFTLSLLLVHLLLDCRTYKEGTSYFCLGGAEVSPLPAPLRACQSNSGCCFRNFWSHVLLCPLAVRPLVRATVGVVSVKVWNFAVALARGGGGFHFMLCGKSLKIGTRYLWWYPPPPLV